MVTASQLSRIDKCPASAVLPRIRTTSQAAERGTAIHAFLAAAGRDYETALANVPDEWRDFCASIDIEKLPSTLSHEVAFSFDVVTGEARLLKLDADRAYPDASPAVIFGTADVVGVDIEGGRAFVGDYFTGANMDKRRQLDFLALCVARSSFGVDTVGVDGIHIRHNGTIWRDSRTLDILDLEAVHVWLIDLLERVNAAKADPGAHVSEGDHCRYCPCWSSCSAKTSMLRALATADDGQIAHTTLPLSRETVGIAYRRLQAAKMIIKRIENACFAALDEFGEVPLPDGKTLRRVISPGKERVVDHEATVKVLREMFGDAAVDACSKMTFSKDSISTGMREIFGKAGAASTKRVIDALRAHGAIERGTTSEIVEVDSDQ